MDIEITIKFDDGKILKLSEEKGRELYWKLKGIYDLPTIITIWPQIPEGAFPIYDALSEKVY